MSIRTVKVSLGDKSYPILIGPGALDAGRAGFGELLGQGKSVYVVDETVWRLHGGRIMYALGEADVITIPSGEASKSYTQYASLCEDILATGVGRDGLIVAVGGGVVGDLAGFAAATIRRGMRFVQIPTTLLAQVDSSVGGKTAINSASHGKNLIGAFHQPSLVLADTTMLESLPPRELRAGYAEVVKYGLLGDRAFFYWLTEHGNQVLALDTDPLVNAVETSCKMKAAIVAADEREHGQRALLNLGHTFGHALEAVMGYSGRLLHGEAVAAGMGMAFRYSAQEGLCDESDARLVEQHLSDAGLATGAHDIEGLSTTPDEQIEKMYQDKKVAGGALTFILARSIGDAFVKKDIDPDSIRRFLTTEIPETS